MCNERITKYIMKAFKSFIITLAIVLLIGCIFLVARGSILQDIAKDISTGTSVSEDGSSEKKANPVTKAVVSTAIDTYIENTSNEKVKEIAQSMSDEDMDEVKEILASKVSLDSITDVQSMISGGDTGAMLEYAEENLSEEEIQELKDIMSKYVTP